jgi:hypothetical protein
LLSEKADVFDNTVNEDNKAKQARRFRQFKRAFNQVFPTDANKNAWLAHYKRAFPRRLDSAPLSIPCGIRNCRTA